MAVRRREAPKAGGVNPNPNASTKVWLFSLLLTLQYGAQPLISKRCTSREVIVTSCVLACEVVKVISAIMLLAKDGSLRNTFKKWTLIGSLTASGLPAAIYALQNSLLQISYRNLDSLTFSMLNQTKLFFHSIVHFYHIKVLPHFNKLHFCHVAHVIIKLEANDPSTVMLFLALSAFSILIKIMVAAEEHSNLYWFPGYPPTPHPMKEQKQSIQQIGALFLLIIAAILLSIGEGSSKASSSRNPDEILFYGIIPVLVASVLSGLASALCQWASQIPVVLNAVGGILVGLVTSYAGGVRKGFVIVSALLVTALLQFIFDGNHPLLSCGSPIETSPKEDVKAQNSCVAEVVHRESAKRAQSGTAHCKTAAKWFWAYAGPSKEGPNSSSQWAAQATAGSVQRSPASVEPVRSEKPELAQLVSPISTPVHCGSSSSSSPCDKPSQIRKAQ
ncbi:UNVERIFIED_CONTAM: UDP-N-acetylglucosamine transporter ROCK1 [Sesamum calycinum]|uniref:UDP-N-acetylglucosamine transporter ROCK1 n=1 Tax=Sesamum calycinum TaxID=2727403 RepID=A0AAW2SYC1_9LAMI